MKTRELARSSLPHTLTLGFRAVGFRALRFRDLYWYGDSKSYTLKTLNPSPQSNRWEGGRGGGGGGGGGVETHNIVAFCYCSKDAGILLYKLSSSIAAYVSCINKTNEQSSTYLQHWKCFQSSFVNLLTSCIKA